MSTATAAVRGIGGSMDYRPVASYGRISKRRKGDGAGAYVKIEKQHEDNTDYIHAHFPGAPVAYYTDNLSAWSPSVVRKDWNRMLADIAAGNLRACVAWHADRYTRQPKQLEEMWEECKATGTEYHTVRGGHVTNPLYLRIEGALAANDSDLKSEKISRRHRTLAEEGKPSGGRRRFGYNREMTERLEPEASALEDAAKRFLDGETLYSLAKDLTARGFTGTSGGTITGPNLGTMLRSPHLAGIRVHSTTGTRHKAVWPALISETDHELINERLSDPARKTAPNNARVHLLAGLMKCAECGKGLRGRPLYKGDGRSYACPTGRHCHRPMLLVDAVVEARAIKRLQKIDASAVLIDDEAVRNVDRLTTARKGLKEKREAASAKWAMGEISDDSHYANMAALDGVESRIVLELSTARAAVQPLAALEGLTGPDAASKWEAATLDGKRAAIHTLFSRLELVGAEHGRKPFVPADVLYDWREHLPSK